MTAVQAFTAYLTALPVIIKLGQEFMTWLNVASGGDPKTYIAKLGAAMSNLNAAQTQEERQNAAQEIAKAISGL